MHDDFQIWFESRRRGYLAEKLLLAAIVPVACIVVFFFAVAFSRSQQITSRRPDSRFRQIDVDDRTRSNSHPIIVQPFAAIGAALVTTPKENP